MLKLLHRHRICIKLKSKCSRTLTEGDKRRKRGGKPADAPRASMDEIADFYAGLVNGDGYLPSNAISNTVRSAMLERGLVTAERLRERGVA